MRPITNNTEFIIGIDFGHGETSARFYNLQNQDQEDIDILPGQKVIKSAVAILRQEGVETICVGDSAIQKAPMAIDFQVSFKKRPSEMKPDERKRMVSFMKGVYEGILDRHPDYKTRDHRIFIARPSQDKIWKNEETAYIAIAEEAGLPVAGIQKESRAAYFRARTQPDSKIDNQVEKGVLIVDFGSSTIDFTYLNKDLSQPIDDGANLGANAVETSLLKYALSHPQDPTMPEFARIYGGETKSNAYNQLLYKFRVAKEEFYGKKLPNFSVGIDYSLLTSAEKQQQQLTGWGGITLTKGDIRKILESEEYGKYIPTVEAAVKKFKDEKLKNQKVACVYLTGGASRMDFVREIFMKVFNLKAEQCPSDDNPSFIVSQGVAHLSYADYKTAKQKEELEIKVKNLINNFKWESTIKKVIYDAVKSDIKHIAYCIMTDWKDGKIYETNKHGNWYNIRSLRKTIEDKFDSFTRCNFAEKCSDTIREKLLSTIIEEIKMSFSSFHYEMEMDNDLKLDGFEAKLSSNGVNELKMKFTGEGDNHILYDSIAERNLIMVGLNLSVTRSASARKEHFDYYCAHHYGIFYEPYWDDFFKNNLSVKGIEKAKKETSLFVEEMMKKYISYAKLAIFFK